MDTCNENVSLNFYEISEFLLTLISTELFVSEIANIFVIVTFIKNKREQ